MVFECRQPEGCNLCDSAAFEMLPLALDAQPTLWDSQMKEPLTDEQTAWVEKTLDSMSIGQCVGHLMMPYYPGTPSDWGSFDETPPTVEEISAGFDLPERGPD